MARSTSSIADAVLNALPELSGDSDVSMQTEAEHKAQKSASKGKKNEKKSMRQMLAALDKLEKDMLERAEKLMDETLPFKAVSLERLNESFPSLIHSVTRSSPMKQESKLSSPLSTPTKSLSSSSSSSSASSPGLSSSSARVLAAFSGAPAPNLSVQAVLPSIRSELREMVDVMKSLKLFVQLNMPALADDDANQEMQEEAIGMLAKCEDEGFGMLTTFNSYNLARGKLVAKTLRFPDVEDYWEGIRQVDEEMFVKMKLATGDLRNQYLLIRDALTKNEQVLQSRDSESDALDESMF